MTKIAVIYIHKNYKHRVFASNYASPIAQLTTNEQRCNSLHDTSTLSFWTHCFAIAECLKRMPQHVQDVQRWIYDSASLLATIDHGDKGGFAFVERSIGWQLARMTRLYIERWASWRVERHAPITLQSQDGALGTLLACHSVLMSCVIHQVVVSRTKKRPSYTRINHC